MLKAWYEKAKNFLNPQAPEIIMDPRKLFSYYTAEKWKTDVNTVQFDNHSTRSFGGYGENFNGIYHNDLIVHAIAFSQQHMISGSMMNISLRWELSRILNKNHIVDDATQQQMIISACEDHKLPTTNLNIYPIESKYSMLFSVLRNEGVAWLSTFEKRILFPLWAEHIAAYLYDACQQHESVRKLFEATKLSFHKKHSPAESSYYSMIEVAIRLHMYLNGQHQHCGIEGQIRYDKILGLLINGKDKDTNISDYPALIELHEYVCKHAADQKFSRVYIAAGKSFEKYTYEELEKQLDAEKVLAKARGLRNKVLFISAGIASALGMIGVKHYYETKYERDVADKKEQALLQYVEDKDLISGFHGHTSKVKTPEEKKQLVQSTSRIVYDYLVSRYSIPSNQQEPILALIAEDIVDTSESGNMYINNINFDLDERRSSAASNYLENTFLPKHTAFLELLGCELSPYKELHEHQEALQNTIALDSNFTMTEREASSSNAWSASGIISSVPSTYVATWHFLSTSLGESFTYYIVNYPTQSRALEQTNWIPMKQFIIAKSDYDIDGTFSITAGKKIAEEVQRFLKNKASSGH